MFNNWYVMSAKEAQNYCQNYHDNKTVIISINNSFEMPIKLTPTKINKVVEVLTLSFDDVLKKDLIQDEKFPHIYTDEFGRAYDPISKKDAQKIHDFAIKYHKMDDEFDLIVHCEMGVSRSAAVMAAILKGLYNDDMPIYKDGKYRPNPDVYRAVYTEFEEAFIKDNMLIDVENLRFTMDRTPFNYNPCFEVKGGWRQNNYVPSNRICQQIPELQEIVETVECWGSGLPSCNFKFAKVCENEPMQKGLFYSYFTIDSKMDEYLGEDSDYKNTAAWNLIESYKKNYIPDITVITSTEVINGIEYEVKEYYILLYNMSSLFFYQENLPFEPLTEEQKNSIQSIIFEVEYSLPKGYKSYGYFNIKNIGGYKRVVNRLQENVTLQSVVEYVVNCLEVEMVYNFNRTEEEDSPEWNDAPFLGVEKKNEDGEGTNYTIIVFSQNGLGNTVETDYEEEEWETQHPKMTGIRLVKISY